MLGNGVSLFWQRSRNRVRHIGRGDETLSKKVVKLSYQTTNGAMDAARKTLRYCCQLEASVYADSVSGPLSSTGTTTSHWLPQQDVFATHRCVLLMSAQLGIFAKTNVIRKVVLRTSDFVEQCGVEFFYNHIVKIQYMDTFRILFVAPLIPFSFENGMIGYVWLTGLSRSSRLSSWTLDQSSAAVLVQPWLARGRGLPLHRPHHCTRRLDERGSSEIVDI
jgi:hypothetical protein